MRMDSLEEMEFLTSLKTFKIVVIITGGRERRFQKMNKKSMTLQLLIIGDYK